MMSEAAGGAAAVQSDPGWEGLEGSCHWEDLILPAASRETLLSVSGDLRFRAAGTQRAPGRSPGIRLLFAGEPGTGKRLAVRVLATELGVPAVSIDLATLLSEGGVPSMQRLDRLFAAAERANVIVYFNDAGVWLGESARRSSSASSRSDEEVAALLERIDKYRGAIILAATLGIGRPEVIERIDAVVEFPFPDERARREIWPLQLPAGARLDPRELDFLAASFRLAGGTIRDCCVVAAAEAASERAPVSLRHLVAGVERCYQGRRQDARARAALDRFYAGTWDAEPGAPTPERAVAPPGAPTPERAVAPPRAPTPERAVALPHAAPSGRMAHAGRRPDTVLVALLLVCVVLVSVVGFGLARGHGTSPAPAPALDVHASVGLLRVSIPSGWHRGAPPRGPQLGLQDELALVGNRSGGILVLGRTATSDPSLLPSSLLAVLPGTPTAQIVSLGGERLYRYLNLSPRGASGQESVYALPSTIGTIVGVCYVHGAGPGFASTCERIVGTIRPVSGSVLALGPSVSYAQGLRAVIAKLTSARSAAGARLRSARTPRGQAKAAGALAAAYSDAGSAVARLSAGPAQTASDALSVALTASGHAYAALADAASHNDAKGYSAASGSVARAAGALRAAFSRLAGFGYRVS